MEFIFKYWSQITVLITAVFGGIGCIIKLLTDWDIKKKEIKYSTILTKRTVALEGFVFNLYEYQRFFTDLNYYEVGSQKIKAEDLDKMLDKYRIPYSKSYHGLNIYIEYECKPIIKEINNIYINNRAHLSTLLFSNLSENEGYVADDYYVAVSRNNEKLNKLVDQLISSIGFGGVVIK